MYIVMRSSASVYNSERPWWARQWKIAVVELDPIWVTEKLLKEHALRPSMISTHARGIKRIVEMKLISGKLRDNVMREATQLAEKLNKEERVCSP